MFKRQHKRILPPPLHTREIAQKYFEFFFEAFKCSCFFFTYTRRYFFSAKAFNETGAFGDVKWRNL